jgi:hypothetical protein
VAALIDQQRLRLDLGLAADDTTNLPDETIDDIFDEAGESYTDAASIKAATRVIALDRLLIQAASQVDYTQNNTTEKASQRYTHLSQERAKWQGRLDEAIGDARSSSARFGRTSHRPTRIKEYPGY